MKNNARVVYLFVLHRLAGKCTKIYNACRTIVRLINSFVLRRFRRRCGLRKFLAVVIVTMSTYECSVCFYICDLNLEVIEKFQANMQLSFSTLQKVCTIYPWKFPEIRTGIYGPERLAPLVCERIIESELKERGRAFKYAGYQTFFVIIPP